MQDKVFKIAYSNYFKSNIRCTAYTSDNEWRFVIIDKNGNPISRIYKAQTPYSRYNWK